jgi:hypothetical protein
VLNFALLFFIYRLTSAELEEEVREIQKTGKKEYSSTIFSVFAIQPFTGADRLDMHTPSNRVTELQQF